MLSYRSLKDFNSPQDVQLFSYTILTGNHHFSICVKTCIVIIPKPYLAETIDAELHNYPEDIPCEKTYNDLSRNTINLYIYEKQLQ